LTVTANVSLSEAGHSPSARAEAAPTQPGRRHITALDGMRGIAVLLVLLFHFKIGPFHGGFVGVTVFFTLSGFLICSRTLTEIGRRGTFKVLDFFERRVRRLAPAAIACIVFVVIATNLVGTHEQHASVPGDALAALANVANWRFLIHGTSYTDLFAAPSPLNHFWSLAIEEQFYLLFPAVVWVVLKLPPRVRAAAVAILVAVALEWAVHAATTADNFNRFYYGTDARMAELLIGVILALSLHYWHVRVPQPAGMGRLAITLIAGAGLATILIGGMTYRNGGLDYQHGGAFIIGLASAALIVGGLEGSNGVARLCSVPPLVWVGKVSYGAYLYHWPIYALSGKSWGPLHGTALGIAQLSLSLLLAGLSFRYLEAPIQRRKFAPSRRILLRGWSRAIVGAAALTVVLGLVHPARGGSAFAQAGGLQIPTAARVNPGAVLARTSGANRPLRVVVTGDSTSRVIANALINYQNAHPTRLQVLDLSLPGCPITPTDRIRNYTGEQGQDVSLCGAWMLNLPARVAAFKPDVSVVFLSVMEETDQRALSGGWDNVLDPSYRARQEDAFGRLVNVLSETGAPVTWADAPYFKFQTDLPWISDAPDRTDELNAMYRDLAASHRNVTLLNYAVHLNRPGHVVDTSVRPDGIHMNDTAAANLLRTWLLPTLDRYKPHDGSDGSNGSS
jgi:peptidoglycan/LPS O-acetylase OafA/YrhL